MRSATRLHFDSVDPPFLSHFWAGVTGYRIVVNEPDYIRLEGRGLGFNQLVFREVERWKAAPNRVQLELVTSRLAPEIIRLQALGARLVSDEECRGERRIMLRDPEGNEFALIGRPRPVRVIQSARDGRAR